MLLFGSCLLNSYVDNNVEFAIVILLVYYIYCSHVSIEMWSMSVGG